MKQRVDSFCSLLEVIHQTFTKSTKTRRADPSSKVVPLPSREETLVDMIAQAAKLQVSHPEVDKLKLNLREVREWGRKVELFLLDPEQNEDRDVYQLHLKEAVLFKLEVPMVRQLQAKFDQLDWKHRAANILSVFKDSAQSAVSLNFINSILQEGELKHYHDLDLFKSILIQKQTSQQM